MKVKMAFLIRPWKALPPTTTKHGVPKLFHEPHVETGFRHLYQPWTYYVYSFFQIHNECMNCWTHFLALVVTLVRIGMFWTEFDLLGDPYMWPLSAGLITMVILYLFSTCAHCFHNKSELLHYTCFTIDYSGVGLYGVGSVILHHTYCFHDSLLNSFLDNYSIAIGAILSIIVTFCCSNTIISYSRPYPRTWQIGSVFLMYAWQIIPVCHRVFIYMADQEPRDDGIRHHVWQVAWFSLAGFFFGSDVPQRMFPPGSFDFFGHSHQCFHVFILMASYKQLDGIHDDILRMKASGSFERLTPPTFISTFGVVLLVIVVDLVMVCVFRKVAISKIRRDRQTPKGFQNGAGKHN